MVKQWFGAAAALAASAGMALAQVPTPAEVAPTPRPPQVVQSLPPLAPSPAPLMAPPSPAPTPLVAVPADPVDIGPRVWGQAEYLRWHIKNVTSSTPALFGTIPNAQAAAGGAGLPAGSISGLQDQPLRSPYSYQNGLRLSLGGYTDDCHAFGLDGSFFQLEDSHKGAYHVQLSGSPVIGPVFDDPFAGRQTILLFSSPGVRQATLDADRRNSLWGAEVNARHELAALLFADRLEGFAGFRYLDFTEGVDLSGFSTAAAGAPPVSTVRYSDSFGARNQFYGAQIGLASHTDIGRFSFDLIGKIALGVVHEVLTVDGQTTITQANGTVQRGPGGVLAQPTNMGRHNDDEFTFLPEFTLNAGYQLTPGVRIKVGYNFLYLSNALRVNTQFDGVDGRQVFGSAAYDRTAPATRPQFTPQRDSRFWVDGLNAGIEISF